ncbi:HlyD family type I secretion periplasmic adaptor subunit [Falsiroseomonas sp.]|uniref:HlyD family type I secretion periplasmic adaptor subunit n=1 Tax=Falsiroseomonas sp. TaxID=2870721 RepID=UPI003F716988
MSHLRRIRPAKPRLAAEAVPFQEDLEALIAEPPSRFLGGAPWLLGLLALALLVGAALARIDVVVTGHGRLVPDAPPLVLQPMERAVLRELLVRPGQAVRRGEVLALLDPTFSAADREALAAQAQSLRAQLARVEAELAGGAPVPGDNAESALQAVLQAQRQALRATRLQALEGDIRALEQGLQAIAAQQEGLAERAAIARDVEQLRARLLEGQIGSRLNLLAARVQRLEAEQALETARSRQQELSHSLAARRAEHAAFQEEWTRLLLEDAVRLRGELVRVTESLAKAERMEALTTLRAPADGVVLEVARRSAGSVLREAEPLVVLVPADAPLIAEISLRSADIGHLRIGDPVVLKVDAFPFQRHGPLHGSLRAVSRDSFGANQPAGGEPLPGAPAVHRGQVEIAPESALRLEPGLAPIPGMTLTAEIKVGDRSVLGYFLTPLLRGMQESLREP